ncbi:unnamed protein product (macronuclear) [Paramecium tetraurelia]|uniref:Uncharacterized protein n=1 Tax=Paramecium tetraurelia TaxID=5888 RepID=A0CGA9_PARTE|nr:uncharacterized protein GSPATT00038271001 [Paramecium tetraurelia]CAK69826.1 unnamed protein product [Paramecium tetraurelia]|eukprot:XP_001437223.1 hypothetical protein (macronuclear) [Paramecium tetraurelia strain d4-2]
MLQQECCASIQIKNKPYKYELISEHGIHQKQLCYAIAINDSNTLLTCSAYKNIKILQFKNGQVKQIQEIYKHKDWITTLNFFKKRPNFVSGSQDASIIIWFSILMPSPKYMMKLKGHSKFISCLVLDHIKENLLISGSGDGTIKFWSTFALATSEWSCSQTINQNSSTIYECSLREDGNQLVTCFQDCKILIIDKQHNQQQWEVKQVIQLNRRGYRLQFINNQSFVFVPYSSNDLRIYNLQMQSNQELYFNTQNIPIHGGEQSCMCFFPSKYNKQKNVLIIKNGYYINCLRFQQSPYSTQLFDCDQTYQIDCGEKSEGNIFGTLSNDGEFLIFWDSNSKEIKVKKYTENI